MNYDHEIVIPVFKSMPFFEECTELVLPHANCEFLGFLRMLAEIDGLDRLNFRKLPRRQSDQDYFVANIRKAERLLDWKPKVSAEDGITAMLEWSKAIAN